LQRLLAKAPLRLILIIPFILQIGFAVGLTGWLSLRNGQIAVEKVADSLWNEISARVLQHITDYMASPQRVVADTVAYEGLVFPDSQSPEFLTRYLWHQMRKHEGLFITAVGHETGAVTGVGVAADDRLVVRKMESGQTQLRTYEIVGQGEQGNLLNAYDFDVKDRPWYRGAVSAGGPTWTEIYPNYSPPFLIVSAVAPIYGAAGNNLIGVTNATLSLEKISDFLKELEVGVSGQVFIIERSGNLVASSTGEVLSRNAAKSRADKRNRLNALDSHNSRVSETTKYLFEHFGELDQIQQREHLEYFIDRERQIVQVSPFSDEFGLNWLVVVTVPESDFMEKIHENTRLTVFLCLVALALATISGVVTARWITQPILQLNQVARNIARGHLEQQTLQETIASERTHEIGELVGSFVMMTNQLQTSFKKLQSLNKVLADNESRLQQFLDALPVGVSVHDASGQLTYLNQVSKVVLNIDRVPGIDKDQVSDFFQLYRGSTPEVCPTDELPAMQALSGRIVHTENIELRQSDRTVPLEIWASPIFNDQGQVVYAIVAFQDISDRKQIEQQLIHNALHDKLTDLPNRTFLSKRLELAIYRAKRSGKHDFAVLFLDLDRFKVINDSLGHMAGDELLVDISKRLQNLIRNTDVVVRLGGDEFVVLLEEINGPQAVLHFVERVFMELQTPLPMQGRNIFVTTSVGIVFGSSDYDSPSQLLRDADIALYRAKAQGRSRYEIFDAEMHTQALKKMHLESDLRRAVDNEEFAIHYQPIFALNDGSLIGFEALVRWHSSSQGAISPESFIPVAEETGLIVRLDRWVLRSACRQLAEWHKQFPGSSGLKISVNVSSFDLREIDFVETIEQVLAQTGLKGEFLTIEITERMIVENFNKTIDLLFQLRSRDIRISIDDFGTGYSSLSYLCNLPIDNLKIDKSFVSQMREGNKNYKIVQAIVALSEQLDLNVVSEGIETDQQLEWLKKMGCEFGQGYLFFRPLPPELVTMLLEKGSLMLL